MTSNSTPDNNTLRKAREWAESGYNVARPDAVAAAEVIQSLPDEWVDADKLREALDWRDSKPSGDDYDGEFHDRLRALLPAPPTMATVEGDDAVVDADKLREWMNDYIQRDHQPTVADVLTDLQNTFLTPPTMADVEWDDAVHHLAEAALPRGKRVVMIGPETDMDNDQSGVIICADPAGMIAEHYSQDLTPTGKRYRLTPDDDGMEQEQA